MAFDAMGMKDKHVSHLFARIVVFTRLFGVRTLKFRISVGMNAGTPTDSLLNSCFTVVSLSPWTMVIEIANMSSGCCCDQRR
jgi:hypothetical protein